MTYRRVSELFTELENTGLMVSQTGSKGRHGYGTQYKLTVPPEVVGTVFFPDSWENIVQRKKLHAKELEDRKVFKRGRKNSTMPGQHSMVESMHNSSLKDFLGTD